MRGRPGRGAVIGAGVGLVLVAVLFAPAVLAGDSYELIDSLAVMAAPLLLAGAGLGALIGARPAGQPARPAGHGRRLLAVLAAAAVGLAVWTMVWATGLVDVAPLGVG
ncbi:MAG TPA: hypothetical protein VFR99_02025 [Marmoricola sp.]|nr:hypothetical protein [Marmoricola sp.]